MVKGGREGGAVLANARWVWVGGWLIGHPSPVGLLLFFWGWRGLQVGLTAAINHW